MLGIIFFLNYRHQNPCPKLIKISAYENYYEEFVFNLRKKLSFCVVHFDRNDRKKLAFSGQDIKKNKKQQFFWLVQKIEKPMLERLAQKSNLSEVCFLSYEFTSQIIHFTGIISLFILIFNDLFKIKSNWNRFQAFCATIVYLFPEGFLHK